MNIFCDGLISSYLHWVKGSITTVRIGEWCEITTPFVDRFNDYLQVYVRRDGDNIELTDDGYIISNLDASGCDLSSDRRRKILTTILNGFGIKEDNGYLHISGPESEFPQMKHAILQAMLAVDDMFMTSRSDVTQIFLEDVQDYLRSKDIRFMPSILFRGDSGLTHSFDFGIPASNLEPERIVQTINNPTSSRIKSLLFSWSDTKSVRQNESILIAILNDNERPINKGLRTALRKYEVLDVPWSDRDKYKDKLAG